MMFLTMFLLHCYLLPKRMLQGLGTPGWCGLAGSSVADRLSEVLIMSILVSRLFT